MSVYSHSAFEVTTIADNKKLNISCFDFWGNGLLVGQHNTGQLRRFQWASTSYDADQAKDEPPAGMLVALTHRHNDNRSETSYTSNDALWSPQLARTYQPSIHTYFSNRQLWCIDAKQE
jgi:hypothetical protein